MVRWFPSVTLSKREQFLIGRMTRTGKLFAFLRQHRHELFDGAFQAELEGMYRTSGEGKEPVAPALLAMVLLLQAYTGTSDAQAVELAIVDARWQMGIRCMTRVFRSVGRQAHCPAHDGEGDGGGVGGARPRMA